MYGEMVASTTCCLFLQKVENEMGGRRRQIMFEKYSSQPERALDDYKGFSSLKIPCRFPLYAPGVSRSPEVPPASATSLGIYSREL
jgi:hypothetical protein